PPPPASLPLPSGERPQQLRFDAIKARLPDNDTPLRREAEERMRGMSLGELRAEAAAQAEARQRGPPTLVEWPRRFAAPVSAWIFGALAVPLFFTRRVFSRAGGSVLGVAA